MPEKEAASAEDPPPDDKGQPPDDEDDEHIVERDPTGRYGRVRDYESEAVGTGGDAAWAVDGSFLGLIPSSLIQAALSRDPAGLVASLSVLRRLVWAPAITLWSHAGGPGPRSCFTAGRMSLSRPSGGPCFA